MTTSTVSKATLSHINSLILAALSYEECMTAVRVDYANGAISKDNARIALATGYVHHIGAKIEAEIKALDKMGADKMSAKDRTAKRNALATKLEALQAQRNAETGKAERSTALEQRVNRDLKAITAGDADKMSAKAETRDNVQLTTEQLRLLAALDATFDTYSNMRKGIASYIANASAK
jgi:hypothetical protein